VSRQSRLAAVAARAHRLMPRMAGQLNTSLFINTRRLDSFPDDLCPLGARRLEIAGVPRVGAVYIWGSHEPTVLALHGWGTNSTIMAGVVDAALANNESAICFDAPGHGVSPGSHATITEYAQATFEILQRFPGIHTVVAHSLASIAAVAALGESGTTGVRDLLLLAPACSLSHVLERWALKRHLPRAVVARIYRELDRRDGVQVSHWDVRTLGVPASVRVRILHDPADTSVPLSDSQLIACALAAELQEVASGTGHDGLLGSAEMRATLSATLQTEASSSPRESR